MRSPTKILLALLFAGTLAAQNKPPAEKPAEEKPASSSNPEAAIIPVKTLTGDSFDRLVKLLQVFGARFTADDHLRTIVVYGPSDLVSQMRRVVAELDRPGSEAAIGRNIEMTLTFLRCSTKKSGTAAPLPPDIEPAARQLRAATQYKDIELWDVVPLHLQEGKETTESLVLPRFAPGMFPPTARILVRPESVGKKETGRYVRFARLEVGFKLPITAGALTAGAPVNTQFTFQDVGLNTAGDFFEGQKAVLGKVSGVDDETAIFVVIALKILD